jgi:hypothetical protein
MGGVLRFGAAIATGIHDASSSKSTATRLTMQLNWRLAFLRVLIPNLCEFGVAVPPCTASLGIRGFRTILGGSRDRLAQRVPVSVLLRNAHGVAEWKLFLNE